jgi:inorganic pyrophosphatase
MKAVIEMPMGTRFKYEIDKITGALILDRPINAWVPYNYGFIPDTLCDDGDPIDVFVVSLEPIPSLTVVDIEIIGCIKGIDHGSSDDKILAFVSHDGFARSAILMPTLVGQVKAYLSTYKDGFKIGRLTSAAAAVDIIVEAKRFWLQQNQ